MKQIGIILMAAILFVGLKSETPIKNFIVNQGVTNPSEIGQNPAHGANVSGPSYVLPNVEYTYFVEKLYPELLNYDDVYVICLDPSSSASISRIGTSDYYALTCEDLGAYYICVKGKFNGNVITYDTYPVICVAVLSY